MTEKLVRENERVDDLQNGYYVIQDPEKFCFGMDAVLLSGFTKVKKGENALDMGTGTGIDPGRSRPSAVSAIAANRLPVLCITYCFPYYV